MFPGIRQEKNGEDPPHLNRGGANTCLKELSLQSSCQLFKTCTAQSTANMEYNTFSRVTWANKELTWKTTDFNSDPKNCILSILPSSASQNNRPHVKVTTAAQKLLSLQQVPLVMYENNRSFQFIMVAWIGIISCVFFFSLKTFSKSSLTVHLLLVNFVCNSTSQFVIITAILLMWNHPS